MSYSNNPLLPKARADAVRLLIEQQLPVAVAARKSGVHRTTLWRWKQRWLKLNEHVQFTNYNRPSRQAGTVFRLAACKWRIPTLSSRPLHSPSALPQTVIDRIVYWRNRYDRCAAVVHAHLRREGVVVSLASVKRVLKRLGLVVRKTYHHYRPHVPRPLPLKPGDLVQTDTIHLFNTVTKQRVYLYTLIDLYSRWAYAEYHDHISQKLSYEFITRGEAWFGRPFACVQSDNGPEFGARLKERLYFRGITLRHSRVRKPNDNAHIERFNRTIQQEGLNYKFPNPESINRQLFDFLAYYNQERLHSSLQYRTPQEVLQRS